MEDAGRVGLQVELRRHAVHRVDHAAELRDEEAFITLAEVSAKCTGTPAGNDQLVDAGDTLVADR